MSKPFGYWTFQRVKEAAAPFQTRSDFRRAEPSAYQVGYSKRWLEPACAHMRPSPRPYSRAEIAEVASRYTTLALFRADNEALYACAWRRGWLDIFDDLQRRQAAKKPPAKAIMPAGYWTEDRIADVAKTFKTRVAFQRGHNTAYVIAFRRGWLDKVCSHMRPAGSRMMRVVYKLWCDETREVYIGLTRDFQRRYAAHKNRKASDRMASFMARDHQHTIVTSAPIPAKEAAKLEHDLICQYTAAGWSVLNIAKAGGLGGRDDAYWTMERLQKTVSKYATRSEFRAAHPGGYGSASKRGLIEILFSNHDRRGLSPHRAARGTWTTATLRIEAKKHATRKALSRSQPGAYLAAHRLGVMDAIFADHPTGGYDINDKRWKHKALAWIRGERDSRNASPNPE